jgi:hypothetical protein
MTRIAAKRTVLMEILIQKHTTQRATGDTPFILTTPKTRRQGVD